MLNSLREQARSHISIEISLKILRWSRNTAMDIQQIVMLAELAANRMMDNLELPKSAPHR
ncbi:hypothetical protein EAH78_16260 [Pseudomonas arsenicoxydans]|uniref:Uncharacterized protein n=1 Tax=Pseudomonas arsenicoxydans TaxID=702115 RepID=A0A502HSD6_9PSED|nr:hypothetical protein [Pseudomonas arsenicoxydans]TPG76713.1 hypothetical protein EAH78_16260 [Pseudomonas arsenicoxydans]